MTAWEPDSYKRNAGFVAQLGAPVVDLLAPRKGEHILDLGCGDGTLTRRLVDCGCIVVGIDASPDMASAARQLGIDARVGDGHELTFHREFDAVFSNAALHWMKQPRRVALGVWRSLKQTGRFAGEMGGVGNVRRLHQAMRKSLARRGFEPDDVDPWYFPSPEEYTRVLQSVGFTVKVIELIERPTPLPTGVRGWLEAFAQAFVSVLDCHEREEFNEEIESTVRPYLCDERGVWHADYVRLRFLAFKN